MLDVCTVADYSVRITTLPRPGYMPVQYAKLYVHGKETLDPILL